MTYNPGWSNVTVGPGFSRTGPNVVSTNWALVAPQVTGPDVDFELQFRESYPMLFSEARALRFMSTMSEGNP